MDSSSRNIYKTARRTAGMGRNVGNKSKVIAILIWHSEYDFI